MEKCQYSKLCKLGFGLAAATVCFLGVLVFALLGYLGYNTEALGFAAKADLITLTPAGVLVAAVIHGIKGFIVGYVFAFVYNFCPFHRV